MDGSKVGSAGASETDPPAGRLRAFRHGFGAFWTAPCVAVFGSYVGYGALAHDASLSLLQTLIMAVVIFALPAHLVLIEETARGTTLILTAFAVTLTSIRFLPLGVLIAGRLAGVKRRVGAELMAAHFVSAMSWIEAERRLPRAAFVDRMPKYLGIGSAVLASSALGAMGGFLLAGQVTPMLAAALIFLTPAYFIASLLDAATRRADHIAILLGLVLGPILTALSPSIALLVAGVAGGTIAWGLDRLGRRPRR